MKLMPGADVWFHPGAHELQLLSNQPLAAKVTYVHHSGLVNLIVWGKGGETFQRASVPFWDADGDRPTTNHASWISEDGFDVPDAPYVAAVARHPFEGRPSGGVEDLERDREARSNRDRPMREPAESEAAYKARVDKWYDDNKLVGSGENFPTRRDPSVQADGQAKSNADHGPPRSFGQSPNAGGPVAIDDHEPKPEALTPSSPFQGSRMRDRDAESPPPPAAFATPRTKEAEADKAKPDEAKADADKQGAADENQQKADKSAKDKTKAADKSP